MKDPASPPLAGEKGSVLILHIDGASRGNPGMAGAGVWVTDRTGESVGEVSRYLGTKTNNEAEYWALLLGLQEAKRLGGKTVHVLTDSELIARQVRGIYRVKDPDLRILHQKALQAIGTLEGFEIDSVPREENRRADRLANQAIDRRIAREKGGQESRRGTDGRSSDGSARRDGRGEESPSSTGQGGP